MQFHDDIQELKTARAFNFQSADFDRLYQDDLIIRFKRETVRNHLLKYLMPADRILELNSGTGDDAIFLEKQGFKVHATDISEGMLDQLRIKASIAQCKNLSFEICSFNALDKLRCKDKFDHIFSNFAGLNCSADLAPVLHEADKILRPGGKITLVLLPSFCLWELLMVFKGKWKTAFRRFKGRKGAAAKINDFNFTCYYYNPSYIMKQLAGYELMALVGLCSIVPPSYIQGFGNKYPGIFSWLKKMENKYSASFPWRSIGDYYIITLQKPSQSSS